MSSNAARTHAPFGTLLSIDSGTTQLGNARASVYAGGGAGMHDVNPASNTPASNTAAIAANTRDGITPHHQQPRDLSYQPPYRHFNYRSAETQSQQTSCAPTR
jgi:hypothetical protein